MGKLVSENEVLEILQSRGKKKVGYTSGAFDLLHAGHVDYLQKAKTHCDVLVVGINSDSSVKAYKDPKRPINKDLDRAAIISALACVDYVFIFDDLKQARILQTLKPDLYIKGGDYKEKGLSSAKYVEEYGGKVLLIDFKVGYSSTRIVNKILDTYGFHADEARKKEKKPALFLDRDGTLIEEIGYIHEPEKVKVLPGVIDTLKKLQDKYYIIVVTNQPGIGMGYYTKEDFFKVNIAMMKQLNAEGVLIDKIYFCPHAMSEDCNCRKPKTGMIDRAISDLPIDLENSIVVGDRLGDYNLAKNVGCKGFILFGTEKIELLERDTEPKFRLENLSDLAQKITI